MDGFLKAVNSFYAKQQCVMGLQTDKEGLESGRDTVLLAGSPLQAFGLSLLIGQRIVPEY